MKEECEWLSGNLVFPMNQHGRGKPGTGAALQAAECRRQADVNLARIEGVMCSPWAPGFV